LHQFDPSLHQPHPPGYPVFIAAGRFALAIIHLVAPSLSYLRADTVALAIWSAIGGAIAIFAAVALFREMTRGDRRDAIALWAAALMAATPLFWLTGLRPMSDMFGFGVALGAQALIVRGLRDPRSLVAGAIVAGLAAGIRSQSVPLTLPLLLYALVAQRQRGLWLLRPVGAFVAAVLAWAIPLLAATGGIDGYLRALGSQAGEDFAWVDMLWANPTPRALAFALVDTFISPFAGQWLAAVVLVLAAAGALLLLVRDRRALLLLAFAYLPYAVFHLLFQESANLRYATPLVAPVALLVAFAVLSIGVRGRSEAGPRVMPHAVLALLACGLLVAAVPAGVVYGREVHPAFRAVADMTSQSGSTMPAAVFSHFSLRRPLQATPTKLPVIEPRRTYEWLALEDYWLKGGKSEVWFLADPVRTDLGLIDPQARRRRARYRWSVGDRPELKGTRPLGADWYRFTEPPGWFAAEGWELTPETTGVARVSGKRLHQQPITAYVRRRSEPVRVLVAGRHLGPPANPASAFAVSLDDAVVRTWRLDPARDGAAFFQLFELPAIPAGAGDYAKLTIAARAEQPGVSPPEVAVEQFDVQPLDTVMFGFGDGWYEAEYDNARGRSWRWSGARATLRIVPARTVVVKLQGESPLRYFDAAPTVRIKAGDREIASYRPAADFSWRVRVPVDALAASGGAVTIETDKLYLPGQAEGTADARRLGLRLFEVSVEAGQ
jgi:hypothetical protein